MPKTAKILLLIKTLLVIPFGILSSSLVLYITHQLKFSDTNAIQLVASFLACGGLVRIAASYVGNQYFSYYGLLCLCAITLSLGCLLMIIPTTFYWGLTLAIIGSGLTIVVNCILTEMFYHDNCLREKIFLWSYSCINIGYLLSMLLSGYFELSHRYTTLFIISSLIALLALIVIIINHQTFKNEKLNVIVDFSFKKYGAMLVFLFLLYVTATQKLVTNYFILSLGMLLTLFICYKTSNREERKQIFHYLFLVLPVLAFWAVYHLTPMILTLFIERNVDRHFLGLVVSPQWVQLISTTTIIVSCPLLATIFHKLSMRGISISIAMKFALALCLIGLSLFILSIGIHYANENGMMHFHWIIASFILQGVAEVLITPIGFAMIGQYAPEHLRGIMMGHWMMLISVGAVISGLISTHFVLQSDYRYNFQLLGMIPIIIAFGFLIFQKKILKP